MRVRSAFEFFRLRPENPILILIVNMFVTCVLILKVVLSYLIMNFADSLCDEVKAVKSSKLPTEILGHLVTASVS